MTVLFDSGFLMAFLDSEATIGNDLKKKINHLIDELEKSQQQIVIPTPCLSEFLIKAENQASHYLDILNRSSNFRITPFGMRAAVEAAAAHQKAITAGDKKEGQPHWQKVKFDRQIASIAIVENVTIIYTNDSDLIPMVSNHGIDIIRFEDLLDPPSEPQGSFVFEEEDLGLLKEMQAANPA